MAKKPTNKQSQCGPVPEWYREGWKPSYFCIYAKHAAGLLALDDATLGKLYRAQLSYLLDRASTPPNEGIISLAFNFCRASMDEDFEHGISRSWQAYNASHSREGVEAAKEGIKHRTTSDDIGRGEYITQEHITQEHNNSITQKQQKPQETSSTSLRDETPKAEEDSIEDDSSLLSSFSEVDTLRSYGVWVCKKHDYQPLDFDYFFYGTIKSGNVNLDTLIEYLFASVMQGAVDKDTLFADAKEFLKEKARREALDLPVLWDDWNEVRTRDLFEALQLKEKDRLRFYDTRCDHSENGALLWIAANIFSGKVTAEELRSRLDEKRQAQALEELAKVTNDKLSLSVVQTYCKIKGYEHIDAARILQAEIRGSWQKYIDACERKALEGIKTRNEELF